MAPSMTPDLQPLSTAPTRVSALWARRLAAAMLACSLALCLACGGVGGGGGGGGSGTNDPGELALTVDRSHIDSGDIARVRVDVFDINENGVVLKLKFTNSLSFMRGSAFFYKDEDKERAVTPNFDSSDADARYLVFIFSRRSAYGRSHISLDLDLKAVAGDPKGYIEVDLDNNDPVVPDSQEFSAKNPRFSAQERSGIRIDGTAGSGSATPTPAATAAAG